MDKVTTDLIAKAMEGDVSARLTLAEVFNDPQHNFYYPGKSLDMYVKLAREGNQQAYYPLAEMFSNPDSEQYNPARSVLYLKKLQDVPKGRILLSEVLSYRVPLSRISTEITSRDIPVSDPYYQLLKALEYFPFDSASAEMRKHLIEVSELDVAAPFRKYIYPALILPIAAQTSLFRVAEAALGGEALSSLSWHLDTFDDRWYPVTETKGIEWVKFVFEPDGWRGQRLAGIVVSYPAGAKSALQDYYSAMMTPFEDGLRLPGVFLRFKAAGESVFAEFVFTAVKPLLKPSRLPDEPAMRNAIPRMLFTSTIEDQ